MIDPSVVGISVGDTCVGLVRTTRSLRYYFRDELYSLVFIGHCYIVFLTL